MSEKDQHQPTEPSTPNRIGVLYYGILADRIVWQANALSRFEQVARLKTAVTIKNESQERVDEITELGDTLALRRLERFQDMFTVRTKPTRFLNVDINLLTARAQILIDDQGLATEQIRSGRFEEDVFISEVDELARSGLKKVLSKEKHSQVKDSGVFLSGMVGIFAPFAGITTVWAWWEIQSIIKVLAERSPFGALEALAGSLVASYALRGYAKTAPRFIPRLMERLMRGFKKKDPVYSENFTDSANPFLHILALREGKKALSYAQIAKRKNDE